MTSSTLPSRALRLLVVPVLLGLSGCAVGVGVGIPLAPGLALNLGIGPSGPGVSLSTGWGPFGAGVGVNAQGQVVGSAGVGASAGPVGVGVGRSVVLHDPKTAGAAPPPSEPGVVLPSSRPPARLVEAP